MPIAPPTIPAITEPLPLTSDPTNFDTRADQSWTDLQASIPAMNVANADTYANALEVFTSATDIAAAAAVAIAGTEKFGESTSTLSVDAGTKDITLSAPKTGFSVNGQVAIVLRSDASIRMFGNISPTGFSTTHMNVVVVSSGVLGSGTYSDWDVVDATFMTPGATAAQTRAGVTADAAVTPAGLLGSKAFQVLTDAASIAWDVSLGASAQVTIAADRAVAAPTNLADGVLYTFMPIQGTGGSRKLTWNAIFDWGPQGSPLLSTAVGKADIFTGQYSSTTGKLQMKREWTGDSVRFPAPDVIIRDEKSSATGPGSSTGGSYVVRTLNTIKRNANSLATLASNAVTLAAGPWEIRAKAPCQGATLHRIKLYNDTDSVDIELGTCALSGTGVVTASEVVAVVNFATAKAVSVRHWTASTSTLGGAAGSGDVEVYTTFEATRLD